MDKTVPVRKVLLRGEDTFYVYDKRINKCVVGACDGAVKYGLILKVKLENGEEFNSFECNKCHTKYTPYANYVRISSPSGLNIVNKDEVAARDKKRAEDAKKQAAREKRKNKSNKNNRY